METSNSKYILVNISIPILLHETGSYDQYPDHIQVSYTPIETLPVASDPSTFQLNLEDYFVKPPPTVIATDNVLTPSPMESTPSIVSPILDLLATVEEKKYLEISNKMKKKIQKANTTFRNGGLVKGRKRGEFTKKAWKYLCEIEE